MARNFFYGLEADNDEIDVGMNDLEKDSQDLIEDAGKDSETVDVSKISESTAAHNEVASAGGVVVSKDNADDLTMDPVAATEAIIRRGFGLSTEDLDDVAEELAVPNATIIASAIAEYNITIFTFEKNLKNNG